LVDPELLPALAAMPNFDTLSAGTLPQFRSVFRSVTVAAADNAVDRQVSVRRVDITPTLGGLLYEPTTARDASSNEAGLPAMLNIHGGGFVLGTAEHEDPLMRSLCAEHGLVILSVDYRLAPEVPFPGAHDDCIAAFGWLHANVEALGLNPRRVGLRGASAGGGLATGLTLRLRDDGRDMPAWLWLLYPMLDDRTSNVPGAGTAIWTANANAYAWPAYLGSPAGGNDVSPYAAPARAETYEGFPPTFLATGAIDLFAAEDVRLAQRLLSDGVPVELHVYPGAYHGFSIVPGASVAARYQADLRAALARFLTI
jgi:acetyl esterase/lipase